MCKYNLEVCGEEGYGVYVGLSVFEMKEDETLAEFKIRTKTKLSEVIKVKGENIELHLGTDYC